MTATDELNKALQLHQAGRLDAAAAIYARLCESNPANPDASYGLGTVLMQQGRFSAAVPLLEQALRLEPGVTEFRHNFALALQGLARELGANRDYAAAIETFEKFMQVKGATADDHLAYADLLLLARKPEAARRAIDQALESGSDVSAAHLIAARCARLEGDYELAREHLRTAIDKRPAFADAWQMRLEIEDTGELATLAPHCAGLAADTTQKTRDRALLAMAAGRAFEKIGDYPQAFAQYELGNGLQRDDQAARDVRYDSVETEQRVARAVETFAVPASGEADPAQQPIFIVGMPRSGTTLVERILGGLDGVVMGGESEAIGVLASQYYWLREKGHPIDMAGLAADYWRREQTEPCRRTDKMPHNFWHIGLIRQLFPAAPIIYMRRDPRDVCMSIYSRVFSDGHPYATGLESLAHNYRMSVDLMQHWQSIDGDAICEVGYEQFIDEPEAETQRIAEHCGLDWTPDCLDFHKRIDSSFTYSEMQVREPLNRKGIGAWRRYEPQLTPLVDALNRLGLAGNG